MYSDLVLVKLWSTFFDLCNNLYEQPKLLNNTVDKVLALVYMYWISHHVYIWKIRYRIKHLARSIPVLQRGSVEQVRWKSSE